MRTGLGRPPHGRKSRLLVPAGPSQDVAHTDTCAPGPRGHLLPKGELSVRISTIAASVVALSTIGLAAPAQAAPDEPRNNVGYCISDGFYGNQPNRDAEGNVVPSQSPGPKRTLPDGTVVEGNSVGDYNSGRATGGERVVTIPEICRTVVG